MSTCRRWVRRELVGVNMALLFLRASTQAVVLRASDTFEEFYTTANGSALVACEAIRDLGVPGGSELLFSCGVFGVALSGVIWHVEPEHCCSFTERYRVTEFEEGRENADVQLILKAATPVRGHVHAQVVDASGSVVRDMNMDFVVAPRVGLTGCECKRKNMACGAGGSCVCSDTSLHYDPVHGVCFSSVPREGACRYHHQCQHNDSSLECLKGRCDCGYGTLPDPASPGGRCLQMARYGERCSNRTTCIVGRCGRDGRCTCADGQLRVRGTCVDPPPRQSPPQPRGLLDANRALLQLPFFAVCLVLLALACVARTTSQAAGWLWHRRDPGSSTEHYVPRHEAAHQQTVPLFPGRLRDRFGLQRPKASVEAAL